MRQSSALLYVQVELLFVGKFPQAFHEDTRSIVESDG